MAAIVLDEDGVVAWTGDGAPDGPVWLRDLVAPDGSPAAVAGLGAVAPPIAEHDARPLLTTASDGGAAGLSGCSGKMRP